MAMDAGRTLKSEYSYSTSTSSPTPPTQPHKTKARSKKSDAGNDSVKDSAKRRCISTACIACRRRKSKCDGNSPACAACASVYGTDCVYDPNSDHRRKGVYKKDIDNLKTRNSTLQTLIQAILNYPQDEVPELIRQIRECESLDEVAESITAKGKGVEEQDSDETITPPVLQDLDGEQPTFESQLSYKLGELRLQDGSVRYLGGTSNLIYLGAVGEVPHPASQVDQYQQQKNPLTSWTTVTSDLRVIKHILNMYWTWHYPFFTLLSKTLFYRDFNLGKPPPDTHRRTEYCTPLLVNAMLALGCHFTSSPAAREDPDDSATTGDHFFNEAKRLYVEHDEYGKPRLATVQALALMSVREAGCGREAKGWVYSGMSFRMASDMGINLHPASLTTSKESGPDEDEEDARRITFWGCFLIDKCWSKYLGRMPCFQISTNVTVPKFEVFPTEDADTWSSYTDSGFSQAHAQPARIRAVALQISALCDISGDLMRFFYHPQDIDKPPGKQVELKRLSDIHTRLETWRRNLPKEMEPREGSLPNVLIMHMFFQLLYIHLFRPFLKYNLTTSPLPAHVSPRKICTQAAALISKLIRLYKRSHGLRQIVNLAVYMLHSASTIHLLNLPEKNAKRDITHGVKHLEEIAEGWLCARRTLAVLSAQAKKWKIELPEDAAVVLTRTDTRFSSFSQMTSPPKSPEEPPRPAPVPHQPKLQHDGSLLNNDIMFPMDPMHQHSTQTQTPQHRQKKGSMSAQARIQLQTPRHRSNQGSVSLPGNTAQHTVFQPVDQFPTTGVFDYSVGPQQQAVPRGLPLPSSKHASALPDMFGGVEALLRGGQEDWWNKDQSLLASGFGNWNMPTIYDAAEAVWVQSTPPHGQNGWALPPLQQEMIMNSDGASGVVIDGFGNMAHYYNEGEWYQ